jgi:hypothetical protein
MSSTNRNSAVMGWLVFLAVHVVSVLVDQLSTVLCVHEFSDYGLSQEFNPLIKGTSIQSMLVTTTVVSIVWILVFFWGWTTRRILYPAKHGYSASAFYRFVPFGRDATWKESFYKLPRLKNSLAFLAVCVPVALTLVHFSAAVTNTLQAMHLMRWRTSLFLATRIAESFVGIYVGFCILFWDYRNESRHNKHLNATLDSAR